MSAAALALFDALRLERRALFLGDHCVAEYWDSEARRIAGWLISGAH